MLSCDEFMICFAKIVLSGLRKLEYISRLSKESGVPKTKLFVW